jgi:2-hydroxy-4-carboxymuconate semialdehyde hemiacetal dehydrogenase
MKIVLAGAGAFGQKHLDALRQIGGIEVVSLVGRDTNKTRAVAQRYTVGHVTTELGEALAQPGVTAAILCTGYVDPVEGGLRCDLYAVAVLQ